MARHPLARIARDTAACVFAVAFMLTSPGHADAQSARRVELFPDSAVHEYQAAADPKPTALATQIVSSSGEVGRRRLWVATLGASASLLRVAGTGERWDVVLGVQAGVTSLFDTGTPNVEMLTSDFYVSVPLTVRAGGWSVSVAQWHESSHLGDEYAQRTGETLRPVAHDQFLVRIARRVPGGRVYAGAHGMSLRRYEQQPGNVNGDRVLGGFELATLPAELPGGVELRGLVGVDEQRLRGWDWARSTTLVTGVELARPSSPRAGRMRLIVSAHDGAAPYWQFGGQAMRWVGAGVHWVP